MEETARAASIAVAIDKPYKEEIEQCDKEKDTA
jgi:hypothetical protein